MWGRGRCGGGQSDFFPSTVSAQNFLSEQHEAQTAGNPGVRASREVREDQRKKRLNRRVNEELYLQKFGRMDTRRPAGRPGRAGGGPHKLAVDSGAYDAVRDEPLEDRLAQRKRRQEAGEPTTSEEEKREKGKEAWDAYAAAGGGEEWGQEDEDWRYVDQGEDDDDWVEELEEQGRKKAAADAEKAGGSEAEEVRQMQEAERQRELARTRGFMGAQEQMRKDAKEAARKKAQEAAAAQRKKEEEEAEAARLQKQKDAQAGIAGLFGGASSLFGAASEPPKEEEADQNEESAAAPKTAGAFDESEDDAPKKVLSAVEAKKKELEEIEREMAEAKKKRGKGEEDVLDLDLSNELAALGIDLADADMADTEDPSLKMPKEEVEEEKTEDKEKRQEEAGADKTAEAEQALDAARPAGENERDSLEAEAEERAPAKRGEEKEALENEQTPAEDTADKDEPEEEEAEEDEPEEEEAEQDEPEDEEIAPPEDPEPDPPRGTDKKDKKKKKSEKKKSREYDEGPSDGKRRGEAQKIMLRLSCSPTIVEQVDEGGPPAAYKFSQLDEYIARTWLREVEVGRTTERILSSQFPDQAGPAAGEKLDAALFAGEAWGDSTRRAEERSKGKKGSKKVQFKLMGGKKKTKKSGKNEVDDENAVESEAGSDVFPEPVFQDGTNARGDNLLEVGERQLSREQVRKRLLTLRMGLDCRADLSLLDGAFRPFLPVALEAQERKLLRRRERRQKRSQTQEAPLTDQPAAWSDSDASDIEPKSLFEPRKREADPEIQRAVDAAVERLRATAENLENFEEGAERLRRLDGLRRDVREMLEEDGVFDPPVPPPSEAVMNKMLIDRIKNEEAKKRGEGPKIFGKPLMQSKEHSSDEEIAPQKRNKKAAAHEERVAAAAARPPEKEYFGCFGFVVKKKTDPQDALERALQAAGGPQEGDEVATPKQRRSKTKKMKPGERPAMQIFVSPYSRVEAQVVGKRAWRRSRQQGLRASPHRHHVNLPPQDGEGRLAKIKKQQLAERPISEHADVKRNHYKKEQSQGDVGPSPTDSAVKPWGRGRGTPKSLSPEEKEAKAEKKREKWVRKMEEAVATESYWRLSREERAEAAENRNSQEVRSDVELDHEALGFEETGIGPVDEWTRELKQELKSRKRLKARAALMEMLDHMGRDPRR